MPTSKAHCDLLSLPEELLVQHILARLDLPTLRSCLSTCRRLNHAMKSSALINYSAQLQDLNLLDDPAVSYDEIPLNGRLNMLRAYRERRIIWRTSAEESEFYLDISLITGEAGILYEASETDIAVQLLRWTNLPSKEDQAIEWNVFHPSDPHAIIVALALSIEENDLVALATWHTAEAILTGNFLPIQIHLIQHSTQLPYPGLSSPIPDVGIFQYHLHDFPRVSLAIRGTNLVVKVGHHNKMFDREAVWTGHLSVWNWKTGEKKCEKPVSDVGTGLVFLREDIFLHGCVTNLSLDVYHISTSSPSVGVSGLHLVERLGLPRVKKGHPEGGLEISLIDNPTTVRSFVESFHPKVPKLFTTDNLSSILVILVASEIGIHATPYRLVTHLRTILGRADRALSSYESGQNTATRSLSWETWGPEVTRLFWFKEFDPDGSCGSRLFKQRDNFIDIYDFGRGDNRNGGPQDSQNPSHYPSLVGHLESGDSVCQDNDFQDVVDSQLPFVYQSFKIDGRKKWQCMYVDESRIVGLVNGGIDVFYMG